MTLKKFFTGQPGNIEEVAEIAKEKDLPVYVLFKAKHVTRVSMDSFSSYSWSYYAGSVTYLFGTPNQFSEKKNFNFTKNFSLDGQINSIEEALKSVKKEVSDANIYLAGRKIKILEFDNQEEFDRYIKQFPLQEDIPGALSVPNSEGNLSLKEGLEGALSETNKNKT